MAAHEDHNQHAFCDPGIPSVLILSPHEAKLEWDKRDIELSPALSDELRNQRTRLLEAFTSSWNSEETHVLANFAEKAGVPMDLAIQAAERLQMQLDQSGVSAHPLCWNLEDHGSVGMGRRITCALCKQERDQEEIMFCKESYQLLCL